MELAMGETAGAESYGGTARASVVSRTLRKTERRLRTPPIASFSYVMPRTTASLLALVLLTIGLAGCFQDEIVIKVRPDGSGTIEQAFVLTQAAVEQMRQMQAGFDPDTPFSVLDEDELREKAAEFGEGVRFVSAEPLETAGGEGYRAVFAFDDVTALNVQPGNNDGPSLGGEGTQEGVRFAFEPGSPARLRILVPQEGDTASETPPAPADSAQVAGAVEMMRAILDGLHVRLIVEPQGTIAETDAAFHDDGQIVLTDVSGDALLADREVLEHLAVNPNSGQARSLIAELPGVQVETQEAVTVTFE